MPMDTVVTLADSSLRDGDQLRDLRSWLSAADELRGRVRLRSQQPQPGTLGMLPEALVVAGPIVAALVPALISWIRSRHTEVSVEVSAPDGRTIKIVAGQVRRLGAEDLTPMIEGIVQSLTAPAPGSAALPQVGSAGGTDSAGDFRS